MSGRAPGLQEDGDDVHCNEDSTTLDKACQEGETSAEHRRALRQRLRQRLSYSCTSAARASTGVYMPEEVELVDPSFLRCDEGAADAFDAAGETTAASVAEPVSTSERNAISEIAPGPIDAPSSNSDEADSSGAAEVAWTELWEAVSCSARNGGAGSAAMSLACERWRRTAHGERHTLWSKILAKGSRMGLPAQQLTVSAPAQHDWGRITKAVRAGVPASMRCAVWTACSGAASKKSEAASARGCSGSHSLYGDFVKDGLSLQNEASMVIEADVTRTGVEESLHGPLRRVLLAFAARNPDIGYCQSMNFIVATLFLYCDEEGYYTKTMTGLRADLRVLDSLVARWLPNLHKHLDQHSIDLSPILMNWLLCLFAPALVHHSRLKSKLCCCRACTYILRVVSFLLSGVVAASCLENGACERRARETVFERPCLVSS
ncbi:unnamed protein product [Polarella glacialis]|uniref:Rab-GAP TBC domain-containing protein n=1 Tax=Polarella glacialis TaxID=89957 RepID=A0A813FBF9_POLGL|nr:unnamed protein product [Polarella glacialis]